MANGVLSEINVLCIITEEKVEFSINQDVKVMKVDNEIKAVMKKLRVDLQNDAKITMFLC